MMKTSFALAVALLLGSGWYYAMAEVSGEASESSGAIPAVQGLSAFEVSLVPARTWTEDAVVALNYDDRIEEQRPEALQRWTGRMAGRADAHILLTELPDGQSPGLPHRRLAGSAA